jgi:hypothetical protein
MRINVLSILSLLFAGACGYISPAELEARFDLDEDGVARPDDCDDSDPAVGKVQRYLDADGDGYGGEERVVACRQAVGLSDVGGDCDDGDARVAPGATPLCELVDADCDGLRDESGWSDAEAWYRDQDGDGAGLMEEYGATLACTRPEGSWSETANDCDDTDPRVQQRRWFEDADGDGYGNLLRDVNACDQPEGFVDNVGDCDDGDPGANPGAAEVCDAAMIDEDCDGAVNEEDESVSGQSWWFRDADGDGFGDIADAIYACAPAADTVDNALDCDDTDSSWGEGSPTDPCPPRALAAGATATCLLTMDGVLQCWGEDTVADGYAADERFVSVGVGIAHACAVAADRTLLCWGAAENLPDVSDVAAPVTSVSVDGYHTCAQLADGGARCWGDDVEYALSAVDGGYSAITAGATHACALRAVDQAAVCVGVCTDEGECADDESEAFVELAAGGGYSCGRLAAGGLRCWGKLRDSDSTLPVNPRSLDAWGRNLCLITSVGGLVCRNLIGEAPISEVPSGVFSMVAVGDAHACALRAGVPAQVECWGANDAGQASAPD